ncbi:hypothetical protein EUGRSUZ_C04177 [Eucalyptus grandis]|uniref:Uncharacterized protein n=2 Tax=Eucalyptus grandis TaxID=71139 RepID=A0ACC3LKK0_EUCGR|nr:hypothetical protein EUGRSUZ_C04177 [Eucalyptus grandis]
MSQRPTPARGRGILICCPRQSRRGPKRRCDARCAGRSARRGELDVIGLHAACFPRGLPCRAGAQESFHGVSSLQSDSNWVNLP